MPSIMPLESESEHPRVRFELLLRCARPPLNAQEKESIRLLLTERIDWTTFLCEAHQHGLMPLLYWHLQLIYPRAVPRAALDKLQHYFRANAKRNLLLIREITRLVGLLQTNDIPAIFFKGPLLGSMIYGNPSLRASADLDILVHQSDFPKIKLLLSAEGYLPPDSFSCFQRHLFVHCAPECHLIQPVTRIELDVHWQMLPRTLSYAFDGDHIWQRVRYFRLGTTQVPTLSPEDLLLFLCVHGSKHFWERLSWICDIAGLIDASPALDWAKISQRAELQGSSRMLFVGLALARDLIAARLPSEISARMRADPEVNAIAVKVRQRLARDGGSAFGIRDRISFHLRVTNRFADKIRYLFRSAVSPTIGDLLLLNSPRAPFFLCYVIRPFRLLTKCGLRAAKLVSSEWTLRISEWI